MTRTWGAAAMGRIWIAHRQAWTPRVLPTALVALVLAAGVCGTLAWAGWPMPVVCCSTGVIGWSVSALRWWWWRRRHPVLSPAEVLERQRRAAPWN